MLGTCDQYKKLYSLRSVIEASDGVWSVTVKLSSLTREYWKISLLLIHFEVVSFLNMYFYSYVTNAPGIHL